MRFSFQLFLISASLWYSNARLHAEVAGDEELMISPFEDDLRPEAQQEQQQNDRKLWPFGLGGGVKPDVPPPAADSPPPPPPKGKTQNDPLPESGSLVGNYVDIRGNCTESDFECELDTGDTVQGMFVCRLVPPILLKENGPKRVNKCIDPEFAHSTDICGCCDGKCAPPCPCKCKLDQPLQADGITFHHGFSMIQEHDLNWKNCVPESEIATLMEMDEAQCDMNCPAAKEGRKKKDCKKKDKGNSTDTSDSSSGDDNGGDGNGGDDSGGLFGSIFGGKKKKGSGSNEDED